MKRPEQDHWERSLKTALPKKTAPEEFKMELKQRLIENNPGRRRQRNGWQWMGLAAALLLMVGNLLWQSISPNDYPLLPSLASAERETWGASAGPGFTVRLDYQLAGGLGTLPDQAAVHRYQGVPFSAEHTEDLARRLGMGGQAEQQAWQDSHIYVVGEGDESLVAFPDGFRNYFRHYAKSERSYGSEAELVAAAKAFLPKLEISEDSVRLLNVLPGSADTPSMVMFVPAEPNNQVSIAPFAQISVGADGQIYAAGWNWPQELVSSLEYPTRTVQQAWEDVLAGHGRLSLEYNKILGPVSGDVLHGEATITAAAIGYVLTYDQNGEMVMQPVAAFGGEASFEDGSRLPITVYTTLVRDRYYSE